MQALLFSIVLWVVLLHFERENSASSFVVVMVVFFPSFNNFKPFLLHPSSVVKVFT